MGGEWISWVRREEGDGGENKAMLDTAAMVVGGGMTAIYPGGAHSGCGLGCDQVSWILAVGIVIEVDSFEKVYSDLAAESNDTRV
jgi:hypothetical protein